MKRFCFWLFNGLLLGGLAFFSFYFFMKGNTFHGWLDLLYMVIVASSILLRRQHHVMEEQVNGVLLIMEHVTDNPVIMLKKELKLF